MDTWRITRKGHTVRDALGVSHGRDFRTMVEAFGYRR
jgi:hypothetical protein